MKRNRSKKQKFVSGKILDNITFSEKKPIASFGFLRTAEEVLFYEQNVLSMKTEFKTQNYRDTVKTSEINRIAEEMSLNSHTPVVLTQKIMEESKKIMNRIYYMSFVYFPNEDRSEEALYRDQNVWDSIGSRIDTYTFLSSVRIFIRDLCNKSPNEFLRHHAGQLFVWFMQEQKRWNTEKIPFGDFQQEVQNKIEEILQDGSKKDARAEGALSGYREKSRLVRMVQDTERAVDFLLKESLALGVGGGGAFTKYLFSLKTRWSVFRLCFPGQVPHPGFCFGKWVRHTKYRDPTSAAAGFFTVPEGHLSLSECVEHILEEGLVFHEAVMARDPVPAARPLLQDPVPGLPSHEAPHGVFAPYLSLEVIDVFPHLQNQKQSRVHIDVVTFERSYGTPLLSLFRFRNYKDFYILKRFFGQVGSRVKHMSTVRQPLTMILNWKWSLSLMQSIEASLKGSLARDCLEKIQSEEEEVKHKKTVAWSTFFLMVCPVFNYNALFETLFYNSDASSDQDPKNTIRQKTHGKTKKKKPAKKQKEKGNQEDEKKDSNQERVSKSWTNITRVDLDTDLNQITVSYSYRSRILSRKSKEPNEKPDADTGLVIKGEYVLLLDAQLVQNMSEQLVSEDEYSQNKVFQRYVQRDIARRVCSDGNISAFFPTSMAGVKPPAVAAAVNMVMQDTRFKPPDPVLVEDVQKLGKWDWKTEALRIRMCAERAGIFGVSFYPKSEFSELNATESLGQAVQILEDPVFREFNSTT